jgi:ketosteroid isomerase-like protein
MSAEQNAALVRRYFEECVNAANGPDPDRALAVLDDLLTDDFVMSFNNATASQADHGRDAHRTFIVEHARHYPDDRWTIEALVADEDTVACQWHILATHARTGNPIDIRAADLYRVRDGRLAALRRFLDFKSLDRQTRRS